jgi:hypothetical protein
LESADPGGQQRNHFRQERGVGSVSPMTDVLEAGMVKRVHGNKLLLGTACDAKLEPPGMRLAAAMEADEVKLAADTGDDVPPCVRS